MTVADNVVPACFHVLMDDIWSDRSNLDQAVMLDENCVASQVTMQDWRITCTMQVTEKKRKNYCFGT